jgi:hypothetical protein
MKKFIVKLVIFLIPLILLFSFIEINLSRIPNSYSKKKKYLEKNIESIEVLALGSSQAFFGIDPACFSHRGINLADVSQTLFYDQKLTMRYANRMKNLKLVIIPVSYFSFYFRLHNTTEGWRDFFYNYYWNIKDPELPVFDLGRYSLYFLYTPQESNKYILKNFRIDLLPEMHPDGYAGQDSSGHLAKISESLGRARIAYHTEIMNVHEEPAIVDDMKKMIQYLKDKNITVVFITMPVFHTYSDHANKYILASNDSITDKLCSIAQSKYFNYFTDPRFNIDDFSDNDHLSFAGAEKLSKIIDSEIIRPILK